MHRAFKRLPRFRSVNDTAYMLNVHGLAKAIGKSVFDWAVNSSMSLVRKSCVELHAHDASCRGSLQDAITGSSSIEACIVSKDGCSN